MIGPAIVYPVQAAAALCFQSPFVGPDAPGQHDLALNDPNPHPLALIAA